jgi:hypothetical protein
MRAAWATGNVREDGTPPVGGECEEWEFYPQTTAAPSMAETWRLSTGRLVRLWYR